MEFEGQVAEFVFFFCGQNRLGRLPSRRPLKKYANFKKKSCQPSPRVKRYCDYQFWDDSWNFPYMCFLRIHELFLSYKMCLSYKKLTIFTQCSPNFSRCWCCNYRSSAWKQNWRQNAMVDMQPLSTKSWACSTFTISSWACSNRLYNVLLSIYLLCSHFETTSLILNVAAPTTSFINPRAASYDHLKEQCSGGYLSISIWTYLFDS